MHRQNTKADHSLKPPPDCGKRLLPALVDEIATNDPGRIFVSIAETSDITDGFRDVDYHSFAKAVDRCAWWLIRQLKEHKIPQTVFYLGPLDLRYLIIILAAAKAGHLVGLNSKIPESVLALTV